MSQVRRAYQAELDALEIWVQVARHDIAAAERLIRRIEAVSTQLASHPRLGRSADHLLPGLRSIPVANYLVFYLPQESGVLVVRIIHGAREILPELFE